MFANILLSFWRNLVRHRLYTALNVAGLALGIATFLTLGLVTRYEYGFDASIPDAGSIARIDAIYTMTGQPRLETAGSSFAMQPYLHAEVPQIVSSVRIVPRHVTLTIGSVRGDEQISYVDPQFFDVFRLPMLAGRRDLALHGTDGIVLSDALARKYFGRTDVVGRTLAILDQGQKRDYMVSGVLAPRPANVTDKFDALVVIPSTMLATDESFTRWPAVSGVFYVKLTDRAALPAAQSALQALVRRHGTFGPGSDSRAAFQRMIHFTMVSLPSEHFHDVTVADDDTAADRRVIDCLFAVGVLALAAAAINYVNLATARALLRAREVAMRKVIGASKASLIVQFLGEAVALTFVAGAIGLALTEMAVPVVASLGGWAVSIDYGFLLPVLLAVILFVGVGAGAYPAFALASFRPSVVLASAKAPSGGRMGARVRTLLVGMQFAFAVGLAICTVIVDVQAGFLRDADRGFERNGLIVVSSLFDPTLVARQGSLLDAFRSVPGVVADTVSQSVPGDAWLMDGSAWRPGSTGARPTASFVGVGRDYFRTYGVTPLAGRVFDDAHGEDDIGTATKSGHGTVVIDTATMRMFGWSTPRQALGQVVMSSVMGNNSQVAGTVIGVVAPLRLQSMHDAQGPQIFRYYRDGVPNGRGTVRYVHADPKAVMAALAEKWRLIAPDVAFSAQTGDDALAQYYRPDEHRGELFSLGAVIAIIVACLGLYGLAAFNATRRLHEIGVRKTLGASARQVLLLVVGQFLRPVAIASLMAWPVAWALMRAWLAGFDQRIVLSPLYFVGVTACALTLCGLTVLGQTLKLARAEPARALRQS